MDQMNMYFDTKYSLKILFSIQLLLCPTAANTEGFCFKNLRFSKNLTKTKIIKMAAATEAQAEFVPPDGGLRVNPKHTLKFNNNSHFRRLI